ncbi:MAG: hypothetical protein BMS9Abin32_404 [Gammaproteobacteria bacterium]|nr:MAG: hypothetical protein BMS9Abin32_404 [Gammaproteobacteria bacterium]
MNHEKVAALDRFDAPYGREVTLEGIEYESGMRLLRIRIREGQRFTVMDIDADSAQRWSAVMGAWAAAAANKQ